LAKQETLPSTGAKKPRFFYGYVVVIAAFCVMVVAGGTTYTFGVFLKPLLTEFGWTRAMTSGAFSLCIVLQGLLYVFTGRLTDRFGPRPVLTACGSFLGLGYLLMSQINAIWQLYLFYGVIIAIGMSGLFVPPLSIIPRWFIKRRGMMTGIVASGVGVGTLIMPPLAQWLISTYSWRTCYIVVGILALALAILAAQFLRRDPGQIGQSPYGESEVKEERLNLEARGFSFQEAIHSRQFWMLSGLYFCHGFFLQAIMVHIVPYAIELRIPAMIAANILAIIGGLNSVGRVGIGSASDRIGNKLSLLIAFIMTAVALLWLQLAQELWMLFLFAALFGFGGGGQTALMAPAAAELFGLRVHGTILGTVVFIANIGGAVGPLIAGYIFDITNSYYLAFLISAGLGIMAIVLTSFLRAPQIVRGAGALD